MDLTGQKFGRWTVLNFSHSKKHVKYWLCKCDCGTVKPVSQNSLRSGKSKSCGCYHNEGAKAIGQRSLKHGDFGTKLYNIWNGMKTRCYNKNHKYYSDYGGRGINVCEEWHDYIPFKEWALSNGYAEGLSIERVDVNKDYCPENCIWITKSEQNENKRTSVFVEHDGKIYTVSEVSKLTGLSEKTIYYRISKGWTPERIFNTPLLKNQYK